MLYICLKRLSTYSPAQQKSTFDRLAFDCYLKGRRMPQAVKTLFEEIAAGCPSFKFNPYHDELGRFTFGPGGDDGDSDDEDNANSGSIIDEAASIFLNIFGAPAAHAEETENDDEPSDESESTANTQPGFLEKVRLLKSFQDDVKNQQFVEGEDPGAVELTYANGNDVIDAFTKNPLLMPDGVSLDNNIEMGMRMQGLPSFFDDTLTGKFFPEKEAVMISLFSSNQPMDYQKIYSNTDQINKTYIDFGNYNYGVTAAAAGYSLDQTLLAAGLRNLFSTMTNAPGEIVRTLWQSADKLQSLQNELNTLTNKLSGTDLNIPRDETLIRQGFGDYTADKVGE